MDNFIIRERVRLSEKAQHPEFRGLSGVVEEIVKSRKMVVVRLNNGKRYGAYPENVIKEIDTK